MKKGTVYFGPPRDFYEQERFKTFAEKEVPRRLKELGLVAECNTEEHDSNNVTYHYPQVSSGISYNMTNERKTRCLVSVLSHKPEMIEHIADFILDQDNRQD